MMECSTGWEDCGKARHSYRLDGERRPLCCSCWEMWLIMAGTGKPCRHAKEE